MHASGRGASKDALFSCPPIDRCNVTAGRYEVGTKGRGLLGTFPRKADAVNFAQRMSQVLSETIVVVYDRMARRGCIEVWGVDESGNVSALDTRGYDE